MKIIGAIILGIVMITFPSCDMEFGVVHSDVPQTVHDSFAARYPHVKDVEWEIDKDDSGLIYEADFMLEGKKIDAEFKPDGTFIGVE